MSHQGAVNVGPLSVADVELIGSWRYPEPYRVYDPARDDLRHEMLHHGTEFLAVRDSKGLLGFCSFGFDGRVPGGPYDDSAIDVGAGMAPARVGHGLGRPFLQAIVDHGFRCFGHNALRATIASWNERALRAATRVGFRPVCTFNGPGEVEFTVLFVERG